MQKQIIYIISGPLGVGKSSLAKKIGKKLGYALVDGDALFVPLKNIIKSEKEYKEGKAKKLTSLADLY